LRHNLALLWSTAAVDGLPLAMPSPHWVGALSSLHNKPFHLRYAKDIHGVVFPPRVAIAAELPELFSLVESKLPPNV